MIRYLLSRGADVNAVAQTAADRDSNRGVAARVLSPDAGATALHIAAREGHVEIASALLDAGANVNDKGGSSETPLTSAEHFHHHDVASLLVQHGGHA